MMTYYTLPQKMIIQIMFVSSCLRRTLVTDGLSIVAATHGELVQRRAQVRELHLPSISLLKGLQYG
jgi:hypothetical protein